LYSGNGVVVDLIYQTRTIDYKIESTNQILKTAKNNCIALKEQYYSSLSDSDKNDYLDAYIDYILLVTEALEKGDLV
jgi:hypothetical protein